MCQSEQNNPEVEPKTESPQSLPQDDQALLKTEQAPTETQVLTELQRQVEQLREALNHNTEVCNRRHEKQQIHLTLLAAVLNDVVQDLHFLDSFAQKKSLNAYLEPNKNLKVRVATADDGTLDIDWSYYYEEMQKVLKAVEAEQSPPSEKVVAEEKPSPYPEGAVIFGGNL